MRLAAALRRGGRNGACAVVLGVAMLAGCTAPPAEQPEADMVTCSGPDDSAKASAKPAKGPAATKKRSDGTQSDCPTCPPPC